MQTVSRLCCKSVSEERSCLGSLQKEAYCKKPSDWVLGGPLVRQIGLGDNSCAPMDGGPWSWDLKRRIILRFEFKTGMKM